MRAVEVAGQVRHLKGWRPDLPDPRDRLMSVPDTEVLPDSVDLRPECPAPFDQAWLGSCTANAISAAMMILEHKAGKPFKPFSRLFIYGEERKLEGTPLTEDSGAAIRDGFKVINKLGAPYEEDWPYDLTKWTIDPPAPVDQKALDHQALYYYRCPNLQTVKASLAQKYPVVFGFSVPHTMMTYECSRTGIVMPPGPNDAWEGGHAVVAVGYDVNFKFTDTVIGGVLCLNSWGPDWGLKGFFWLPMYFFGGGTGALANDCWALRRMEIV